MTPVLRTLAVPAALAATLALASCGTSPSSGAASPTSASASPTATRSGTPAKQPVNVADVAFATMMIPQDLQCVAMADLAIRTATDAKVKALAPKIKKAQAPEIARMSGWFTSEGSPVPGAAGGHDMSGMGGMAAHPQGVMSAKEMTNLAKATGAGFDRMWLKMMVRHHEGAVAMARSELAHGTSPDGREVAQRVIARQSPEIVTMSSILAGLPKA